MMQQAELSGLIFAEALDVPLRERNCLLEAAGYALLRSPDTVGGRGDGARARSAAFPARPA